MAYIDFAEAGAGLFSTIGPRADPIPAKPASLSATEWLVVADARGDRPSTLRTPGRIAKALTSWFGVGRNPRLADERLETLRRIAVLSRYHGYAVSSYEVRRFTAAGFSPDQYELVVNSIAADMRSARERRSRA